MDGLLPSPFKVGLLAGIRVLDLGTMITGPLAASMLADLGAEVIKVEAPDGGDPFRSFAPDGYGPHFVAYNRGKRSVALDLRQEDGRAALRALLREVDVLIENFRPGTLDRLGFADAALSAFPRLVHCRITGFGADGPYAARPAYDGVAQSYGGVLSLFLDPEVPMVAGPTVADNITGYTAAMGILAALVSRGISGQGRRIEVNMLEATLAFIPDAITTATMSGHAPGPLSRVAASQTYVLRCADGGLVTIHLSAPEKFWLGLLRAIEAPELGSDQRFAKRPDRVANYVALRAELGTRFAARPQNEWLGRLAQADVPHAPVLSVEEVMKDPQVRHLAAIMTWPHPAGGEVAAVAPPWRVDGERPAAARRAPRLGEHTGEVLGGLCLPGKDS